jgi:hypothetical protein
VSSVVGAIGGLFLVVWGIVVSVNLVQIMTVHNTLAFVAQQAVRSEAVNGCWTPATNAVALKTLAAQGLPASRVRVSAYSAGPGAPFGAPLTVGVQVTDRFELLGAATPITVTVAAVDTATSQWVPTVGVTANGLCSAPSGLPVMAGAAQATSGGGPFNGQ